MLRFIAVGLALFAVEASARAGPASTLDIRQLQCDAVAAPAATSLVASSDASQATSESSDQSKDFQAAILSDATINGPARANAAASDRSAAADGDPGPGADTDQTPADGVGGVSHDEKGAGGASVAPASNRCTNTLNIDAGDKSKDVKILQVSPADNHH